MQPPELLRIDDRLATLGRGLGAMRLRIGEGLLRLETLDGIRALGFPSLEAYACEALGRTGRWGSDVRALARRLSALPRLRSALVTGALSSSMVELVSRVATPDDDGAWVERAGQMTVRAMRAYLKTDSIEIADDEMPERVAITTTVDRIDAWAFERARLMVEAVGARRGDEAIEAMLAEGLTEILARDPDVDLPAGLVGTLERESRAFRAELAALHETAEAAADALTAREPVEYAPETEIGWPGDVAGIDACLRQAARELARRDLELADLGRRVAEHERWRELGYRSFDHYCRERIGLSPSSMATRVAFARRLGGLGAIGDAVAGGHIGWEAAAAIARVAGPATVGNWIARAQARTVKHLREEIDAVEMAARADGVAVRELGPPDAETLAEARALERSTIAMIIGEAPDETTDEGQMSGIEPAAGVPTTTLRFSVGEETGRFWRALERLHAQQRNDPAESFVAFLVRSVMRAWLGARPAAVAYADVYVRDRWRCASPVCRSRSVTPHHVRFRSHGGGDEPTNVISLCETCHLELVHGGRLTVSGLAPASLHWRAAGWSA